MAKFNVWDGGSFQYRGWVECDNAESAIAWVKMTDPKCHAPIVAPQPHPAIRTFPPEREFARVYG